jgi:hypothetical protein
MAIRIERELVVSALAALRRPAVSVDAMSIDAARSSGLYAFYASDETWLEMGLGPPPDARPLYVGKAETTLASRDLRGHFGTGTRGKQSPTGGSTLRRSLAALLAPARGYRAMPRNPDNPSHFANFGLSCEHDKDLSSWMRDQLKLALWPHADPAELDAIETAVLAELLPPLNLAKVTTPWRDQVSTARKGLAKQARDWGGG